MSASLQPAPGSQAPGARAVAAVIAACCLLALAACDETPQRSDASAADIGGRDGTTDAGATDAGAPDGAVQDQSSLPDTLPATEEAGSGDGPSPDAAPYDLAAESVVAVEEWRSRCFPRINFGDAMSMIATYKGETFVVWVDPDRRPRLAKLSGNGSSEAPLDPKTDYKVRDDGHHGFSIGIDTDGYIHVVGDMHHHPWANAGHLPARYVDSRVMYWRSDKPADISSFTFLGHTQTAAPQNTGYSYTYFAYGSQGELYVAGRVQARTGGGWTPGRLGYGLERYDAATKTWTALGAFAPVSQKVSRVVFWEDNGSNGTAYQSMKGDVRSDQSGRLHLTTTINADDSYDGSMNSLSMTHVLYAYSDDQGQSWHRADGTARTLPMRAEPGAAQASIAAQGHWFGMMTSVDVGPGGQPLVSLEDLTGSNAVRRYVRFTPGSGWTQPKDLPGAGRLTKAYRAGHGVFTTFGGGKVSRFLDPAGPTRTYSISATHHVDRRWLWETGQLRTGAKRTTDGEPYIAVLRLEVH